jgi:hypothetical protein
MADFDLRRLLVISQYLGTKQGDLIQQGSRAARNDSDKSVCRQRAKIGTRTFRHPVNEALHRAADRIDHHRSRLHKLFAFPLVNQVGLHRLALDGTEQFGDEPLTELKKPGCDGGRASPISLFLS